MCGRLATIFAVLFTPEEKLLHPRFEYVLDLLEILGLLDDF
jgi:hypothetical protein